MYQLGHINELIGLRRQALKWYLILIAKVPADSEILSLMGYLYQTEGDEYQALHYYSESYRFNPSKIDVISWLGIHNVKVENYEKAIEYFDKASLIQPKEVKWRLMVASCYRRMNLFQQALELYEDINEKHPDNIEWLRYLVALWKDLGKKEYIEYSKQLKKLERGQDQRPGLMPQYSSSYEAEYNPGMMNVQPVAQNYDIPTQQAEKKIYSTKRRARWWLGWRWWCWCSPSFLISNWL